MMMAKQGVSTVVPRLRFPEFRNSEGWHIKLLGELCKIKTGKKDVNEGAAGGKYPFFTCAEQHSHSDSYSFDTEAILIAGNANVGLAKYFNGKFEAYQRTYVLTEFSDVDVHYLYAYVAAHLRPSLLSQVQTSAMSYIKLPMLQGYELFVPPSNPEQQKIADCLTSLDEVIAAQGRKVEALKTHKRGLMQQLFPREGETRPRLRFPEFRDAPEWQQKTLGEIANVKASGDLDSSLFSETRSGGFVHPVYSNAVERNGLYGHYSVPQYPRDSVTITARGTLGIAFFRDHEFMGIGRLLVVSDFMDVHPRFLTECWNHLAVISNEVTSIPQLTAVTARATKLPIPSIEEQLRIADCLSSLDTQISAESNQLVTLKTHKQGLMQQLFPAPETASA